MISRGVRCNLDGILSSERYFDSKAKDFYELKLGQIINEENTTKFLEILRYVPYLREEKTKIQRYVSGLEQSFEYRIKFNEPKTLEDAI